MKKELVDFLNRDLQFVKGVGPVLAARFADVLGGRRTLDFLLHVPYCVRIHKSIDSVTEAEIGEIITIPLFVKSHKKGGFFHGKHAPTQILCMDKFGKSVTIQFFNTKFMDYWFQKLPIDSWRAVSGKLDRVGNRFVISHPDFIEEIKKSEKIPIVQAIYPSGEGLTQKVFSLVRDRIFTSLAEKLANENDPRLLEFFDALRHVHFPESADDLLPNSAYMVKLAYFELLAHQTAIVISRKNRKLERNRRTVRPKKCDLMPQFYAGLPYSLTSAQKRAIKEIFADMSRDIPMMRLVQGDVGSGKTVVALAAAIKMAQCGGQTAFLAPTDTLSQQHWAKLNPLCEKIGVYCDILTGRDKGNLRKEKLISLRSGRTKLVVGTHALFSEDVVYNDLGLIIVDEQHRFGVSQREALRRKGNNPDVLSLSATPIPRTLAMTIYGDMDISVINEKPAGRLPIKTAKLSIDRIDDLVRRLHGQIAGGAKVFWVCPLIEDSEQMDFTAVESRYEYLKKYFPGAGLVHGQMDKKERDKIMAKFAENNGEMPLLVATTVIEVGIDVPAATIMVIENAEYFGLAALHQLRGRVGRSALQSYCILVYGNNISSEGMKRLEVLCETDDGFVIAEQDLIMRQAGELLGTRQSGWINYHFVDYRVHHDLFKLASRAARENEIDGFNFDLMFIFDRSIGINA